MNRYLSKALLYAWGSGLSFSMAATTTTRHTTFFLLEFMALGLLAVLNARRSRAA